MRTIDEGVNEEVAHAQGLEDDRREMYGQGTEPETKQMVAPPEAMGERKGVVSRFNAKLKEFLSRTR